MKRALISVSNKQGLIPFVEGLIEQGVEIVSTGGTKKTIEDEGLNVTGISDVTGFPEIMDGRVKTLHPMIHGGLLAMRDNESHLSQMREHGIEMIDLVVVNLYPFKETISRLDVSYEEAIENIDIGGPSMLRAAAKNHKYVTVATDPADYGLILGELKLNGAVELETRKRLAAKVFRHTAAYDALIAQYLTESVGEEYPESYTATYTKKQALRYGENPHQQAAFYEEPIGASSSIAKAVQLHGKELSYNNINDADAALEMIREFSEPAVVAVKHTNPCGVGVGNVLSEAYDQAYKADPVSIFGGIVATNQAVDAETAQKMREIFLEIIIAPSYTEEALAILKEKKNLRLLEVPIVANSDQASSRIRTVSGGALVQQEDRFGFDQADLKIATKREPTEKEWADLKLAWKIVKHVKSNAIILAKENRTIGVGAGQMNRVGAAKIAIEQAGDQIEGSALASDAFFPMNDTVEAAAKAGVTAIIQPGGSIRDQESIDKADEYGIAMVLTGIRHFKH
ncbi:bifunctional phosphoribosylaminoimidazolecarboxamide formyltransferase/IMP cyclohydrolase [Alkalihalobacillus sp. AL-G]|uniref:bifunctional phosphoribosylaminoimidazolecarboxamide formyltransferase/IMP cyclohydrolase n=1 Tax=Alkalihalobacillus sp. AL-G TaxID=2926399 RepID=UPI00272C0153|nr:bifunctional phosphoribosylaminoimidazolecarboxamide formyltransferase/IMP cyclohydrolase [Alkalihalobacillus sp. AL-G]WLD93738.1 bifunctional phosphoribosylaminoimidazolecarboxamide formyltransferase/IMP cyclohydrolase [Alkalihalobacillus sp. AL-G]